MQTCFVCHQLNGEGIPAQIPPLAKSDQFAHSNVITVLDNDGEISRQIIGLNRDAAEALQAIEQSLVATKEKRSTR